MVAHLSVNFVAVGAFCCAIVISQDAVILPEFQKYPVLPISILSVRGDVLSSRQQ